MPKHALTPEEIQREQLLMQELLVRRMAPQLGPPESLKARTIGPPPEPSWQRKLLEFTTGYPADDTREMGPIETVMTLGAAVPVVGGVKKMAGLAKDAETISAKAPGWIKNLDMSHAARMQRAAEQGYTVDAFRGAKGTNEAITVPAWFTTNVDEANAYSSVVNPAAQLFGERAKPPNVKPGAQVQPVKLRVQNPKQVSFAEIANATPATLERAIAEGHDALTYSHGGKTWYVPVDLQQIRSRFAAFDPAQRESGNLLASILGGAGLGAAASSGASEQRGR